MRPTKLLQCNLETQEVEMKAYFMRVGKVHRGYLSHPFIVEMKVRAIR